MTALDDWRLDSPPLHDHACDCDGCAERREPGECEACPSESVPASWRSDAQQALCGHCYSEWLEVNPGCGDSQLKLTWEDCDGF